MNKRLILILAGALVVLASTALPGIASAKETKLKCEGTGACTYTDTGGATLFSIVNGDTIKCDSYTGNGEVTALNAERESTTSTVQFLYAGCKEQNTIFHFACSNTATSGNITTNVTTVHNIALPGTPTEAGVLKTNASFTFTCAGGFASTQVTGSVIGEYENKCNTNTGTNQKIELRTTADGVQADTTYTGATFRLEAKTNHTSGGTYEPFAISSTTTTTYNQNVILTCA